MAVMGLRNVSVTVLLCVPLVITCVVLSCKCIYNAFLHPLRVYPGPKLWASTRLPLCWENINGRLHLKVSDLHKRYGPVVRVAPDELSYITPSAWKTICGHRSIEMTKSLAGHGHVPPENGVHGILTTPLKEDHSRIRRALSHAFSDKALGEQESYLQAYLDDLIAGLRKNTSSPQDLVSWYNWTTFDAIGDLVFGESFGCLKNSEYHSWVAMIFGVVKGLPWLQTLRYYHLDPAIKYLIPKKLATARSDNSRLTEAKVNRRIEQGVNENRKDFMSYILKHKDFTALQRSELDTLAVTLIVGGSETTATLLSGATFYLLTNPHAYRKLTQEIRKSFASASDITLVTTGQLKYLAAVLEESLRMFPPVPASLPRVVPQGGEMIDGLWVPAGTVVGVHQYAAYHSPRNFTEPDQFRPERFHAESTNDKERFSGDNKAVLQPFSMGPRNCIGRNMAYAEMRLIMARLLWEFDLELASGSKDWSRRLKAYIIWEKGPLMVNLHQVERGG